MSYVFSLVLSNFLALICFLLVVFNSIHTKRDSMLWISLGMMLLTLIAYVIIGCYDAAAATMFAALRNFICLKYPDLKKGIAVKAAALLFGTAFSAWSRREATSPLSQQSSRSTRIPPLTANSATSAG